MRIKGGFGDLEGIAHHLVRVSRIGLGVGGMDVSDKRTAAGEAQAQQNGIWRSEIRHESSQAGKRPGSPAGTIKSALTIT